MRSMRAGNCAMMACACSTVTRRLLGAKTNPRASAPASMEARASSIEVVAQNLIQVFINFGGILDCKLVDCPTPISRSCGQWRIETCFFQKLAEFLSGIVSAHQRLTNQKDLIAKIIQFPDLCSFYNSTLGNSQGMRRQLYSQFLKRLQLHFKGTKVAAIDSNNVSAAIKSALELHIIMDFSQRIHAQRSGAGQHLAKFCIVQRGQNQQNSISMMGLGLKQLKLIHNKIFAQAGDIRNCGSFQQIGQRSQEKLIVGKNGKRRSPSLSKLGGKLPYMKIFANHAF